MRKPLTLSTGVGLLLVASSAIGATSPAVVEFQTNLGTIAIRPDYVKAPITAANFMEYVDSGFYQGTLFHRLVKDFVLQGGGFSRTTGQLKATRPPIINESTNGLSNLTGTIAMARTNDPNSATSQFYINLVDNTDLDYVSPLSPGYAVFGKVVKGMTTVVPKIEAQATYQQLPFTTASQMIWIDAVYTNETWDTTVAITRVSRSGAGRVVSDPPGIDCRTSCTLSQPKGSALRLTATAGTGYAFGGWRGDCQGPRRTIDIDTNKGNHNCTAVFTPQGAALQ